MVAGIIERKANPYATTTTAGSTPAKPEKPSGKKARIRELERRVTELEAIVAAMPYISPGWVQPGDPWYMPKVIC